MKVLFALAASTREKLFGAAALPRIEGLEIKEVDVTEFTEASWSACLSSERPDILVAGWGTPRIPQHIAEDPNGSICYVGYLCGTVRHLLVDD
jgi:hypothetical protein